MPSDDTHHPDSRHDHTSGAETPPVAGPVTGPPPAPDLRRPPAAPELGAGSNPDPSAPGVTATSTVAGHYPADPPDTTPHRLPLRSLISGVNPRSAWSAVPAFLVFRDTGLGPVAIILGMIVVVQLVRLAIWSRFRWGFDGNVVRVSSGILWRSIRAMDVERIQQVDVQRPLLSQILGTSVLTVETASEGREAEVKLDGLDAETATQLQAAILTARRRERASARTGGDISITAAGATGPPGSMGIDRTGDDGPLPWDASSSDEVELPETSILRPSVPDLVRSALTGSGLLVIPLSIAALGEFAFDIIGGDIEDVATEAAQAGARIGYITIALTVFVIGVVGAVVTTLLRDWEIELVRRGDDLRLTRGLLNRQVTTIPLHRLQVVQYRQNWLRRTMGAGTLVLRSAGSAAAPDATASVMSIPWVTTDDLPAVLAAAMDTSVRTPDDLPGTPVRHPAAARRRLMFRWGRGLGLLVPLAVGAVFLLPVDSFPAWFAILFASLVVAGGGALLLGASQYRRLGHASTSRVVLVTGGVLGATSDWMPLGRLQGVQGVASVFQRRLDLASVRLSPAGSGNTPIVINDVATTTANMLGAHFTQVAAGRLSDLPPEVGPASSPATA